MPGPSRISDHVYEDGTRYGLACEKWSQGFQVSEDSMEDYRLMVRWTYGMLSMWAWEVHARAEKRWAKSQAHYDDVARPSTLAVNRA